MQTRGKYSGISNIGMWTWDVEPDRLYADASLSAMIGMSPEAGASGEPIHCFIQAIELNDQARVETALRKAVDETGSIEEVCRAGKDRYVQVIGRCFRPANSRAVICSGYVLDVTDQVVQDGSLQDVRNHLKLASAGAVHLGLPFLAYMIGMASLEASVTTLTRQAHRKLN